VVRGRSLSETEARRLWAKARSFDDLCNLTVRFLKRELPLTPTHYGPVDPETTTIAPALIDLNRRGFLTVCSQPGVAEGSFAQRAYVDGVAPKATALALAAKTLHSDLLVHVLPPGDDRGIGIPITVEDGRPFTWGCQGHGSDVDAYVEMCGVGIANVLSDAWSVSVVDLSWGRAEYMWDVLLAPPRPEYSIKPHPDLELPEEQEM
jgi:hypothetical protein